MSDTKITITGSHVGALAVGPGASAQGRVGPEPVEPRPRVSVTLEIKGATPEWAAEQLATLASNIRRGRTNKPTAITSDNGSIAWSVTGDG